MNETLYNQIVASIYANVISERNRDSKIILTEFDPDLNSHKVYFQVAFEYGNIVNEPVYLNMKLIEYIKFMLSNWKKRKCIHWISTKNLPKTSTKITTIIHYIVDSYNTNMWIFREIYKEFYSNENNCN